MRDEKSKDYISVSDYLAKLNAQFLGSSARVCGEVCNTKKYLSRGFLFFSVKDKKEDKLLNCFMNLTNYKRSGIDFEDGLEVVVTGHPQIFERNGN